MKTDILITRDILIERIEKVKLGLFIVLIIVILLALLPLITGSQEAEDQTTKQILPEWAQEPK